MNRFRNVSFFFSKRVGFTPLVFPVAKLEDHQVIEKVDAERCRPFCVPSPVLATTCDTLASLFLSVARRRATSPVPVCVASLDRFRRKLSVVSESRAAWVKGCCERSIARNRAVCQDIWDFFRASSRSTITDSASGQQTQPHAIHSNFQHFSLDATANLGRLTSHRRSGTLRSFRISAPGAPMAFTLSAWQLYFLILTGLGQSAAAVGDRVPADRESHPEGKAGQETHSAERRSAATPGGCPPRW